ncbi:MAG: tetratricopeptide repeat protein [Elusimicrobiota bacterium]
MIRLTLAVLAAFSAAAPVAAPRGGDLNAEVSAIVDLFYGHDFERAAPAAAALEARHPGHPAGPLFRAVVEYQRWTAGGLTDQNAWKAVDADLTRAVAEAKAMEKTSPAESNYYLGAALGFRARGLAAQRRFVSAVSDASSSLKHLKAALALDPTLIDAKLGLGMYHYFAARMPAPAKPFARLLVGEGGDRARGLSELWSVANSSGIARMEARAVLSMILSKDDEADWAGADKLLAELMARYPRNPVYRLRRAFVAERRGAWDQAAALADPDGTWVSAVNPGLRERTRAWSQYRAAEARLLQGRYDEAAKRLAALDERRAPKGLGDWIRLRRANLDDARGRRAAAKSVYGAITEKAAARCANGFLSKPFPDGPRDVAPYFSGY